eukprot:gene882-6517_t
MRYSPFATLVPPHLVPQCTGTDVPDTVEGMDVDTGGAQTAGLPAHVDSVEQPSPPGGTVQTGPSASEPVPVTPRPVQGLGATEAMSLDVTDGLGPSASDTVPVSHVEKVLGVPVSSHVTCPVCPGFPTVESTWEAPYGSRSRPQVHTHLSLHVHDGANGAPARLPRGDGTCQAPTHTLLLACVTAAGLDVDDRAGDCGRCRVCCALQPVHPCPGNGLHDEFSPILA